MKAIEYLVDTFINGNISHAKDKAKKHNYMKVRDAFVELAGFSFEKASRAADVLKHGGSFKTYCDTK